MNDRRSATVLVVERHPVHPDRRAEYASMLEEMVEAIRGAEGALWADAAEAFDDPVSFIVVSEWRTSADAEAWGAGGTRQSFAERADPLLRDTPSRRLFAPR